MGGAWERMIRLVGQILQRLLPGKPLNDDNLHTLLLEVEAMINFRPLTDVSVDPDNLLPLTPNHLLRVEPSVGLPPMLTAVSDVYARERCRAVQYMADEFWIEEYSRIFFTKREWNECRENIGLGGIVLLVDSFSPRGHWLLGRVIKLYPGSKGLVRVVDVKTATGILKRPISKLCVIVEVRDTEKAKESGHTI